MFCPVPFQRSLRRSVFTRHKQWQAGPETNQKPSRQLLNFSLPQAYLTKAQQPRSKSTGYCRVGLCCRHNYTLLPQVGTAPSQTVPLPLATAEALKAPLQFPYQDRFKASGASPRMLTAGENVYIAIFTFLLAVNMCKIWLAEPLIGDNGKRQQ